MWIYILVGLFSMLFGYVFGRYSVLEEIEALVLKNIQEDNNNIFLFKDKVEKEIKEHFDIEDNKGDKEEWILMTF